MRPESIAEDRVRGIIRYAIYQAHRANPKISLIEEASQSFQTLIRFRRWKGSVSSIEADERWKSLLRLPETPLDHNFDLMAAEHYAFARKVAIDCGDPHTESVVRTYYLLKSIALIDPSGIGEWMLRTDKSHPVLPESEASKRWAASGVIQGLNDYRSLHDGQFGKPFSSRGLLTSNVGQYMSGAYPSSLGAYPKVQPVGMVKN